MFKLTVRTVFITVTIFPRKIQIMLVVDYKNKFICVSCPIENVQDKICVN